MMMVGMLEMAVVSVALVMLMGMIFVCHDGIALICDCGDCGLFYTG